VWDSRRCSTRAVEAKDLAAIKVRLVRRFVERGKRTRARAGGSGTNELNSSKAVAFPVGQSRWCQLGSPAVPDRSLPATYACFESSRTRVSADHESSSSPRVSRSFFFYFDDFTPGRSPHLGSLEPLCYVYRLLPVLCRSYLAGPTRPTPSISASSAACRSKVLMSAAAATASYQRPA